MGHIRIVEPLGEGGMGSVYVGFDEKLQRRVALKAIHEWRLDPDSRARFLREARILSQLHHPNICGIHEFLESDGREFLVLELVDGQNLNELSRGRPTPALKMRIARQLAEVLAATHAKGIVHRDLKPANVMVTRDGELKVLDFGLARDDARDEATTIERAHAEQLGRVPAYPVTLVGTLMGTLTYMSPEQARGEPITTASDMYSYGLVLQELFTGSPAYEPGLARDEQLERARRGETLPAAGLDPELSALVDRLKAVAPAVRPSALDTVERLAWIAERPKRRLRKVAAWAAAAVLAIVAFAMSWQAYRIRQEATRAGLEAAAAKEVSEFLVRVFEVSDPGESRGATVTARELLDRAGRDIGGRFGDQPLMKARLLLTLARVHEALGLYDPALRLARESLDLREKALSSGDPAVAESRQALGIIHYRKTEFDQAAVELRRVLVSREASFGKDHANVGSVLTDLATVYSDQGKFADAESLFRRSLAIAERTGGPNHPDVAAAVDGLAVIYNKQGKYALAEPLYQRALKIRETAFGPDHPLVSLEIGNLAALYARQLEYAKAVPLLRRALAIDERVLGPAHPSVAVSLNNVAALDRILARYAEAETLLKRSIEINEKSVGPEAESLSAPLTALAVVYRELGRPREAEPLLLRAIRIDEAHAPDRHDTAISIQHLATVYRDERRYAEAEPLYLRAIRMQEKSLGPEHHFLAFPLEELATLYVQEGQLARAQPLYERALAIREKVLGAGHVETAAVLVDLAALERKRGNEERVSAHLARALAAMQNAPPQSMRPRVRVTWARGLALAGRTDEARRLVRDIAVTGLRTPAFLDLCRDLGVQPPSGPRTS